jgi:hypothetical protein
MVIRVAVGEDQSVEGLGLVDPAGGTPATLAFLFDDG